MMGNKKDSAMFLCIASMVILGNERDIANASSIYHCYDSHMYKRLPVSVCMLPMIHCALDDGSNSVYKV